MSSMKEDKIHGIGKEQVSNYIVELEARISVGDSF